MSLELAGRAARRGLADRIEAFGRRVQRGGRPSAGSAIVGIANGIRAGETSTAAQFALAAIIDTLDVGVDFEWQAEQMARYAVPFSTGAAVGGAVVGASSYVFSPGSGATPLVQKASVPTPVAGKKREYVPLKLEPVKKQKRMASEDSNAFDLLYGPPSMRPISKVPKLSTLARRQVARNKRKGWLIRHNRKLKAKALQSRFAYKRLILARLRRKRFVRKYIRNFRFRKSIGLAPWIHGAAR